MKLTAESIATVRAWAKENGTDEDTELNKLIDIGDRRRAALARSYYGAASKTAPAPGRKAKGGKKAASKPRKARKSKAKGK